ncbi:MAG TPA: hypothetical protein VMU32_05765 [Solirubrobacteraceae bacterium]|nr:hypothetical protein [Solirubrobacteraceae bacterium]
MATHSAARPDVPGAPLAPAAKAERLRRFLGPALHEDRAQAEFWRCQSAAAHAQVGAELSDMAAQVAVQTGHGKDPAAMFPGLSHFERVRVAT